MIKGPNAFRTISEASDELGVPQHVLRFWEIKFSFIRPMKRAGGRRFYRPHDIEILRGIRRLLHENGHAIKTVQQMHKELGLSGLLAAAGEAAPPPPRSPRPPRASHAPPRGGPALTDDSRRRLQDSLYDLIRVKDALDRLLAGA